MKPHTMIAALRELLTHLDHSLLQIANRHDVSAPHLRCALKLALTLEYEDERDIAAAIEQQKGLTECLCNATASKFAGPTADSAPTATHRRPKQPPSAAPSAKPSSHSSPSATGTQSSSTAATPTRTSP